MATLQASTVNGGELLGQANYPETLTEYVFTGNYTANTWYPIITLNTLGHTGIMGIIGYGNTFGMGGGFYDCYITCPGVYPISTQGTNDTEVFDLKASTNAGHAPNNEVWQFRIELNSAVSGLGCRLLWQSNRNYSGANGSGSSNARIKIIRLV